MSTTLDPRPIARPGKRADLRAEAELLAERPGIAVFSVVFLLPFLFIVLTAVKTPAGRRPAGRSRGPRAGSFLENLKDVLAARDYIMIVAFINSTIITVV